MLCNNCKNCKKCECCGEKVCKGTHNKVVVTGPKCVPSGKVLTTSPVTYICKFCNKRWVFGEENTPMCYGQ